MLASAGFRVTRRRNWATVDIPNERLRVPPALVAFRMGVLERDEIPFWQDTSRGVRLRYPDGASKSDEQIEILFTRHATTRELEEMDRCMPIYDDHIWGIPENLKEAKWVYRDTFQTMAKHPVASRYGSWSCLGGFVYWLLWSGYSPQKHMWVHNPCPSHEGTCKWAYLRRFGSENPVSLKLRLPSYAFGSESPGENAKRQKIRMELKKAADEAREKCFGGPHKAAGAMWGT